MIKPLGINIKDSDYDVADGAMEKLINWQYRDGALRPLPDRLETSIDVSGYHDIIMHKVGDEDQVNVLGADGLDDLFWIGKIVNGVYSAITPVLLGFKYLSGSSYVVLNGILYFMGDGSIASKQYYYKAQFNNVSGAYEVKDMYAWKDLSFVYDREVGMDVTINGYSNGDLAYSACGIILIRFAFVLKTGEIVLHSPMYPFWLHGVNISDVSISEGELIKNIHTYVPFNLQLNNETLYDDEFVAVNVYASTPYYQSELSEESSTFSNIYNLGNEGEIKGEMIKKTNEPFYLIQTISKEEFNKGVILYAGNLSSKIEFDADIVFSRIDINSIAAGEIMPVDNYSYHKLYGKIKSSLNRIAIERPRTVLSNGHYLMLTKKNTSGYPLLDKYAYVINTEDGERRTNILAENGGEGIPFNLISGSDYNVYPNGILSYPDRRGTRLLLTDYNRLTFDNKLSDSKTGNISCSLQIDFIAVPEIPSLTENNGVFTLTAKYWGNLAYKKTIVTWDVPSTNTSYVSDNRIQYAQSGESSVFPAINSYRVGEGKVMALGSNMVDPGNADIIAVETVGASDGIYTLNIDQSGNTLISSITRTENIPVLSRETAQVGGSILMVTDQGLIAVQNGKAVNISYDFFPENSYKSSINKTRFKNYDLISDLEGNIDYDTLNIVEYLKGSLLAFDGRRKTIWCSNPNEEFSLLFSIDLKMWAMSTRVFKEKVEFFGSIDFIEYGTIYSRYLTLTEGENNLRVLSGEDTRLPVFAHLFTRAIKIDQDRYKKIRRMFTRCELHRYASGYYIGHGVWGKQDLNIDKTQIALVSQRDNTSGSFPDGVRQDLPVGPRKGKYKAVSILIEGNFMPESAVYGFDIDLEFVNENKLR